MQFLTRIVIIQNASKKVIFEMRPARNVYDRCRKVAMIKVTDDGAAANSKKGTTTKFFLYYYVVGILVDDKND